MYYIYVAAASSFFASVGQCLKTTISKTSKIQMTLFAHVCCLGRIIIKIISYICDYIMPIDLRQSSYTEMPLNWVLPLFFVWSKFSFPPEKWGKPQCNGNNNKKQKNGYEKKKKQKMCSIRNSFFIRKGKDQVCCWWAFCAGGWAAVDNGRHWICFGQSVSGSYRTWANRAKKK